MESLKKVEIFNKGTNKIEKYEISYDGHDYTLLQDIHNLGVIFEMKERFKNIEDLKSFMAHIEADYDSVWEYS